LLAKKLAEQGVSTVIGKPHDIFLILSLIQGALVFGRFGGNTGRGRFDIDFINQMEATKSSMFFLHDEGAFYCKGEYESAVKRIYPEEYFSRLFLKKDYFWGEKQRSVFDGVYDGCCLDVSGAPRLDYLRFIVSQVSGKENRVSKSKNNYVLVCSRFAGISPAKDDVSLISDNFLNIRMEAEGAGEKTESDLFRQQVKRWCSVSIDRAQFIDAIYELARNNPDLNFLFRPHPGEDASLYRSLYRFLANVTVDKSGDLSEVLQKARLFIHSESTSGVEAAIIGVPSINFTTKDSSEQGIAGASEIGVKVKDFNELDMACKRLLCKPESSMQEDSRILAPYVYNSTPQVVAIDKICSDIEEYFHNNFSKFKVDSKLVNSRFGFYFARKIFYFLKSIFIKKSRDDKFSGFGKDAIRELWHLIGGKESSITISSGVIYIIPKNDK